jgi:hypothetical protein
VSVNALKVNGSKMSEYRMQEDFIMKGEQSLKRRGNSGRNRKPALISKVPFIIFRLFWVRPWDIETQSKQQQKQHFYGRTSTTKAAETWWS